MPTATSSTTAAIARNHFPEGVLRNATPARLYEEAVRFDEALITSSGAIAALSGAKTGRSPKDKRIVDQPSVHDDVWWGDVNVALSADSFAALRKQAVSFLDECEHLYVVDAFAGWDPATRLKIRIVCSRAYHALFMHNMLIRPTEEELRNFGQPDYVIYNAGQAQADRSIPGVSSETSVALNFDSGEMVILGTEYAGEMKKGVFTIMNYLMPKRGVLSMHCSANEGHAGDVSLFFGLSGTGKTTLSADPRRHLIGDDEHCWSPQGVFNIEGGCYAKCIGLSEDKEPEIFRAIRFGAILENTVQDATTRIVNYESDALTQNTRCSYPIEYIENAKIPCLGGHPKNIILLTCDAFGVLPPVSKLTSAQAMYHFISGYTAKVAGTEMGVTTPQTTFSACFGAAFLVWHPTKYAEMLAAKMQEHGSHAWLVNTGWTGGPAGVGSRISLKYTRAIIDAIHDGSLSRAEFESDSVFGLAIPKSCNHVPTGILNPRNTWAETSAYDETARRLAQQFHGNFEKYNRSSHPEIAAAGPRV
ncbi:MAG: phosphoenolpyruvate carboxykinase (ATP) [Planctomycetota bacterium]|jgi:phosphoenolpyruvate carboxykinase (ATP)|nr:phosphoenolpyruvate carboxykinase (ATP) [Blastopirellula sp.]